VSAPAPPAAPPAAATRPPRALVLAAVIFVLACTVPAAASLIAQGYRNTSQHIATLVPQAQRLTVRDVPGDVQLAPSIDGQVHVRALAEHGVEQPRYTEESTPAGVLLSVDCPDALAVGCSVDYTIEVPRSFAIRVEGGGGDLIARDLTGSMSVDRHWGETTLVDVAGPVTVRSQTGGVEAIGLRSDTVRVDTDSGDVQLELASAPSDTRVTSGYGDIDIIVPGDERYRVSADTPHGDTGLTVRTDPNSEHSIAAVSQAGDVDVRQVGDRSVRVPFPLRPDPDVRRGPEPPEPPDPPDPRDPPVIGPR
jgi:hypothetical protein